MRPHPVLLAAVIAALSGESRVGRAQDLGKQAAPPAHTADLGGAATVFVHLEAEPGVWLEASHPHQDDWSFTCLAPCDKPLPWGPEYRVAGPGSFEPSKRFALGQSPENDLRVSVGPPSRAASYVGGGLLTAGSVGLVLSIVAIAATESAIHQSPLFVQAVTFPEFALELAGEAVLTGLSLAGIIVGVVLIVRKPGAEVTLEPLKQAARGRELAPTFLPSVASDIGELRRASWRTDPLFLQTGSARGMLPLFSTRF